MHLLSSIEDAKQKAEHDKMMREAEQRKQEVRRIIAQLRRQFKKLLERNHELPEHLRLGTLVRAKKNPFSEILTLLMSGGGAAHRLNILLYIYISMGRLFKCSILLSHTHKHSCCIFI